MFGKGKIDIAIQRSNYAPGDTISGQVTLTLKKPVEAREVSVSLVGEQTIRRGGGLVGGRRQGPTTENRCIYDFKQQLDSEREYSQGGEYQFQIRIPENILNMNSQMPEMEGKLGQGLRILQVATEVIGAFSVLKTKWYLLAKFDIPGGLDIKKKTDITIS